MHLRSDLVRFTLFTALGFTSNACSSNATTNSSAGSNLESQPTATQASACGKSTTYTEYWGSTELAVCESGLVHRPTADVTCASKLEDAEDPYQPFPSEEDECSKHADCAEHPHGVCTTGGGGCLEGGGPLRCEYGCLTDSDCDANQVCRCGELVGTCVPSDCSEDSDCGDGLLCQLRNGSAFRCQQPADECAVDSDCPKGQVSGLCENNGDHLTCVKDVVCGRPFLVSGVARLAPTVAQRFTTHAAPLLVGCGDLTPETSHELGQYWASLGLMEHASIAAFARFSLQLMHLGAPSHLLVAAQRAMLDETAHASTCFDIAAQLLGKPVGPGKLPMDHALTETTLVDILRLTIREGCIGATLAAMEAAEAANAASEPHIKAALLGIAADELRHAELAWRFVQWALDQQAVEPSASDLTSVVAEEFNAAVRDLAAGESHFSFIDQGVAARYGVLDDVTRQQVRRAALQAVVAPCATALVSSAPRQPEGPARGTWEARC